MNRHRFRCACAQLFVLVAVVVLALEMSGGCAELDKADAADVGNVPAQVATIVSHATTQPLVEAVGGVATAATGFPISAIIAGIGGLAAILAGIFGSKYGGANAKLDVAAAAAGVTEHATAIANLVSNNNPKVAKVENAINEGAGVIAAASPLVAQLAPKSAAVASEVGTVASAIQQATGPQNPAPVVTITKIGTAPA